MDQLVRRGRGLLRPAENAKSRYRSLFGGSIGHLVEWYDWFAYSSLALYFAKSFFPEGNQTAQLLQAAAVFAIGFLARPVGAWLMGTYADRVGRRPALSLSVILMCAGSFIIAVTPNFATIGMAAPGLLLFARILQGLSVGGEYGASATYISEIAGKSERGLWTSFLYVTLIAGQLLALCVLMVLQRAMTEDALSDWGWRIPFAIGGLLAIVAFWIRRGIDESPIFETEEPASPRATSLLTDYPRETIAVAGLTAAGALCFYTYTTYMQKFLVNSAGFNATQATTITGIALFVFMILQPLFGWASDRVGRRPMLLLAFGANVVIAYPLLSAIAGSGDFTSVLLLALIPVIVLSAYTSISAIVKAELFPAHIRALGVALPFSIANAIFGGSAEYVALWFKQAGLEEGFFIYVSAVSFVGFVVALLLPDTQRNTRIEVSN